MMIPDEYLQLSDEQLRQKIKRVKADLGKNLIILGHHYQRDDVIEFADFRGDSFALSKLAAEQKNARHIVFCGVHFMAEAADIISADDQIVQIPDVSAGCPLADFADDESVTNAWMEIGKIIDNKTVTPITYINSNAKLKAFCGNNEGVVCTSSNAYKVLQWAFARKEKVFFFPDQHLGSNTGNKMGISPEQKIVWNPSKPLGGNTPDQIKNAKIILWDGHCHVHTAFKPEHIKNFKSKYPNGKVIVHPESSADVVNLSDASGSTSEIIKFVDDTPDGTTIAVGTELNLVNRLNQENPKKTIIPLARSLCPNMFKINLNNLCWTLENIGKINIVKVPDNIQKPALLSLERMLTLS